MRAYDSLGGGCQCERQQRTGNGGNPKAQRVYQSVLKGPVAVSRIQSQVASIPEAI